MATQNFSENYIPVKSDTLNICNRLKQIDKTYFVLFNRATQKFEIHSSAQKDDTFCLELPFPFLDERTVVYARKYRRERIDEIMKEIDSANEKADAEEAKKRRDALAVAMENASGGKK